MKRYSDLLARALLVAAVVLISTPSFAADQSSSAAQQRQNNAITSTATPAQQSVTDPQNPPDNPSDAKPCHWWQFRRCNDNQQQSANAINILPPDAPRIGPVIAVDVSTRTAYLFQDGQLVKKSAAAVGSGKVLVHGDDEWLFHTPQGHLKVKSKIVDPVWHKPDWAFVEEGKRIPPPDSPKRDVKGVMGKYALGLGDGYYIHGTDDPSSIGRPVSHGCVRLPDDMIKTVFKAAKIGTDVYIFESQPPQQATGGQPEHHSDLDYLKKQ